MSAPGVRLSVSAAIMNGRSVESSGMKDGMAETLCYVALTGQSDESPRPRGMGWLSSYLSYLDLVSLAQVRNVRAQPRRPIHLRPLLPKLPVADRSKAREPSRDSLLERFELPPVHRQLPDVRGVLRLPIEVDQRHRTVLAAVGETECVLDELRRIDVSVLPAPGPDLHHLVEPRSGLAIALEKPLVGVLEHGRSLAE